MQDTPRFYSLNHKSRHVHNIYSSWLRAANTDLLSNTQGQVRASGQDTPAVSYPQKWQREKMTNDERNMIEMILWMIIVNDYLLYLLEIY